MTARADALLDHLYRLAAPAVLRSTSDQDLLAAFVASRHQAAFNTLVARRHGPMVLNVCRRVVGEAQMAEDAFQATFLVLARKAGTVRRRKSLAAWLYGVAYRIALNARRAAKRKPQCQALSNDANLVDPRSDPLAEPGPPRELLTLLEEEIQRLPAASQMPVALCCLDGLTLKEAATRLGLTEGAVKGHLERGRARLKVRLAGRGLTLSTGLAFVDATRGCMSAAPAKCLVDSTVKAALAFASGQKGPIAEVSTEVLHLTQSVLHGSAVVKLKLVLVAAVLVSMSVLGASGLMPSKIASQAEVPKAQVAQAEPPKATKAKPRVDLFGDPLPDGAISRLGTIRLRHAMETSLAFAPGGKILASSGLFANGVCLWDMATGRPLHQLWDQQYGPSVAFSADGKVLVTVGPYGAACRIDVASGKEIDRFEIRIDMRAVVAFSTDGKTVAIADRSNGTAVVLWDFATHTKLRALKGHAGEVYSIAFAPDGLTLASGSHDKTIRLWDVATGMEVGQLIGHEDPVWDIAYAPDGKFLASTATKGVMRLWDVATGKVVDVVETEENRFGRVAYSPDGKVLAFGGKSGTIRLWDTQTAKELRAWATGDTSIDSLAFSPDGKVLASTAWQSRARSAYGTPVPARKSTPLPITPA